MRMRSPSSAPPVRRRVGSTASTAICSLGKLLHEARQQLIGEVDLPAPPVPVMPTTGPRAAQRASAARSARAERRVVDHPVLERREHARDREVMVARDSGSRSGDAIVAAALVAR